MTEAASSVETAFRPAFDEISRRKGAMEHGVASWEEPAYFSAASTSRLPFELPDQTCALVSMGTAVLAPVPVDQTRPALRVYGAFATAEEAREHAEVVRELDPTCSLVVVPCREWVLLPQNEECRDYRARNAARRDALLTAHRAREADAGDAFRRRVETRDADAPPPVRAPLPDEEQEEEEAVEREVYRPPRRLRVGAEVRGQNFVAMCAIPNDVTGECLVRILGCFDTPDDADAWVEGVATRVVLEDDVLTARTCEWLFPNGDVRSSSRARYRVDELQRIMDAADRNPTAVRDYKAWKAEQDRQKKNPDPTDTEDECADAPPALPAPPAPPAPPPTPASDDAP